MIELDHIYNMDCLEGMKQISDGLGTFETKREEALACRAYVMSIKYIAGNNDEYTQMDALEAEKKTIADKSQINKVL